MKKIVKLLPLLFVFISTGCVNQDNSKEECSDCHIFKAVENNQSMIEYLEL